MNEKEKLFERFRLYFPKIAEVAISYQIYDMDILMIKTGDGKELLYDDCDHSIDVITGRTSETDYLRRFGRKLRRKIKLAGMTQEEFAEVCEISINMLSRYLNGKSNPTLFRASQMAKALGCTLDELLHFPK